MSHNPLVQVKHDVGMSDSVSAAAGIAGEEMPGVLFQCQLQEIPPDTLLLLLPGMMAGLRPASSCSEYWPLPCAQAYW